MILETVEEGLYVDTNKARMYRYQARSEVEAKARQGEGK